MGQWSEISLEICNTEASGKRRHQVGLQTTLFKHSSMRLLDNLKLVQVKAGPKYPISIRLQ